MTVTAYNDYNLPLAITYSFSGWGHFCLRISNNYLEISAGIILLTGPIHYLGSCYTKQSTQQYLPAICIKELAQESGQSYQEPEALFVKCSSKSKFIVCSVL